MSETIMFPTNYELVVKDKATAMQYAISQARVYNEEKRCCILNLELVKNIYKLFCDNVILPDVADGGCCGECPTITHHGINEAQKEAIEDYEKALKGTGGVENSAQTYDDVAKELFKGEAYSINKWGARKETNIESPLFVLCTSYKQAQKVIAINCLLNVARFLNGEWKPDWNNEDEPKFYLEVLGLNGVINISDAIYYHSCIAYFRTKELAQRAVDILGEDTIRLALSTDY